MRLWYFAVSLFHTVAFATLLLLIAIFPIIGCTRTTVVLTIYPRVGSQQASGITAKGPGLVLMGGGGEVDSAFVWMCNTIAGDRKKNCGDIVVLRASGDNDYDHYLLKVARFNSVQTIKIEPGATESDLTIAASVVDRAQGVFFAGGDQANYVWWKGTPLAAAVQRVYDRGGVVGGNSAGLAVQGEWVYDSVAADVVNRELTTNDVVPDPSSPLISFTHNLFVWPPLRQVITDTHFHQRNRLGRLAAFLARLKQDHGAGDVMGVGIDTGSALLVDKRGIATLVLNNPSGSALFLRGGEAQPIVARKPLLYRGIRVTVLDKAGQTFDFNTRCAHAPTYSVSVNGNATPIYNPENPYKPARAAIVPSCHK